MNNVKQTMLNHHFIIHFSANTTVEQLLNIITPPGRITELQNRFVSYFFTNKLQEQKMKAILALSWFIAGKWTRPLSY